MSHNKEIIYKIFRICLLLLTSLKMNCISNSLLIINKYHFLFTLVEIPLTVYSVFPHYCSVCHPRRLYRMQIVEQMGPPLVPVRFMISMDPQMVS